MRVVRKLFINFSSVRVLTKTCICEDWVRGMCPLTDARCKFAHGHNDLRSTNLRAPRGPVSIKVPLPNLTPGKQKSHRSIKQTSERAGDVHQEVHKWQKAHKETCERAGEIKQEAHRSHRATFERAGFVFEEEPLQQIQREHSVNYINNSWNSECNHSVWSFQGDTEARSHANMIGTPTRNTGMASLACLVAGHEGSSMVTIQSAQANALDSMQIPRASFQAGHSFSTIESIRLTTRDSIHTLQAGSTMSTLESLPDVVGKTTTFH